MKKLLIFLIVFISFFLGGCRTSSEPITVSDFALDTYVSVTVYDARHEDTARKALDLCSDYELLFSMTNPQSTLYELNHSGFLKDSVELSDIIYGALEYCRISHGALDITVSPLSSLWDFTSAAPSVPDNNDITDALKTVSYDNVSLIDNAITLQNGASIDLGAVAKGYIADAMRDYLVENGVKSAIIRLGGNILCIGSKPDGSDYAIGIEKPFYAGEVSECLLVSDYSVVTSGIYQRYFEENGILYHHIIDPSTGYPVENNLYSVTIVSPSSFTADCLSTACFVLGLEEGIALLDTIDNAYGIFITSDYEIYYSEGAKQFVK